MTPARLPSPPDPAPVVPCRCCGRPLRVDWQPGFLDAPGFWQLTCDHLDCDLAKFTIGLRDYPTKDLSAYLETGRKRREVVS